MRNLTAIVCLTLALLLVSAGVSWSADFQKGLTAYNSGDYATALREWEPLAKQGGAVAQRQLGLMYYSGHGVSQDNKTAVKWYRLSSVQGNAKAQYSLGYHYQKGLGVTQDVEEAVRLYTLAAKKEHGLAQNVLGEIYLRGDGGIPQNYSKAFYWHKRAADHGFVLSWANLGYMFANGLGAIQDYVVVHMWFNIAASSGNKDAVKNRGIVANLMTPAQIADAQKLARECVRKKYKGC